VNDSLGHDAGDKLLGEVAAGLATVVRPSDTVARLGGDEFAVLLEDSDEDAAVTFAERLLAHLDEPIGVGGHQLLVGGSIGIAVHHGGEGVPRTSSATLTWRCTPRRTPAAAATPSSRPTWHVSSARCSG